MNKGLSKWQKWYTRPENKERQREYDRKKRAKGLTLKRRLYQYKLNAQIAGKEFNLSEEDFEKLTQLPCNYCGDTPEKYNGVDRVDSAKGYFTENCVPCCATCNRMKMDSSVDDFKAKCIQIVEHLRK